jgi:hypothetical protein
MRLVNVVIGQGIFFTHFYIDRMRRKIIKHKLICDIIPKANDKIRLLYHPRFPKQRILCCNVH